MFPDVEAIADRAAANDFSDFSLIAREDLRFVPEFRMFCEENRCGCYGNNYSCPPASGTVEELAEKAAKYENVLVLRTNRPCINAMDMAETMPIKKDHSKRSRKLLKELKTEGLLPTDGLTMLAGPCTLCMPCKMTLGEPCSFPEERASCLSAYCVDVTSLAECAGMELSWAGDQVSFFSLYLF